MPRYDFSEPYKKRDPCRQSLALKDSDLSEVNVAYSEDGAKSASGDLPVFANPSVLNAGAHRKRTQPFPLLQHYQEWRRPIPWKEKTC